MTFEAFGLAEPLSRALKQCAYTTPTPIQVQALPAQLENRDLLALAETGSGKTAAFVLPILNQLATQPINPNPREVVTLILAPTRELALQIDAEVASLARNMNIRRAVVLGGVSKGPQISALKRGVHVLVATPGRLLDHVGERYADLRSVRTLVLDEADRMFDMGFIRDIRKIVGLLPRQRRTALLSATMPNEIRALANELLTEPVRIDLSPKHNVVDRIAQKVMVVRATEKQSRLHTILKDDACSRVIVFTRTKRGADRVTDRLAMAGIGAAAIHGNKAQNARQRALADFSAGHVRVLVATDIAARGIDVSDVSHVINFDMPLEAETYVHRIGRTARKGTSGIAISLCDPSERPEIKAIERLMKQTIEVIDDVGGEVLPMPEKRAHDARDGQHHSRGAHRGQGRDGGGRSDSRGEGRGEGHRGHRGQPRGEARGPRSAAGGHRPREDRAERRPHAVAGEGAPRADAGSATATAHVAPTHAPAYADRAARPARPERAERSERPARHERSDRGERPAHHGRGERSERGPRTEGGHGRSEGGHHRSSAPRSNEHRSSEHRAPKSDHGPRAHAPRAQAPRGDDTRAPRAERPRFSDGPRGDARSEHPRRDGDKPRQGSPAPRQGGERRTDDARKPHTPGKGAVHARGEQQNWNGQKPPKFLKSRSRQGDHA